MKKILILFFLTCSQLLSFAQNDSQLLRDVASICATGRHETTDLILLRLGAERFGMPQLAELADMYENRILDVQNKQSIAVVSAVLAYAELHYGKESLEAVVCRRYNIARYSVVDWERAHDLAVENTRCAGEMSRKNKEDKASYLLDLTVQLDQISIEKQHDEDNPNHWAWFYKIEKELEPYFKDKIVYTEELVDACQYMARLQMSQTTFVMYAEWMMREFFPNGVYMEGMVYNNDLFLNMEQFMQHAFDGAKILWGENNLRTLFIEMDLLAMQMRYRLAEFDTIHNRLREIHTFMRDYLPQGDLNADMVELLIWECDITYNEKLYEIRSAHPILSRVRMCYGENSEIYLNVVCQLATMMMMVDVGKGMSLLEEAEKLLDVVCVPNTDLYDSILRYLIVSKQVLASENPEEFQNYSTKCIDYYKQQHRLSWESVYLGKSLANVLSSSLLLYDNAVELQQIALEDIKRLTGKESAIYVTALTEFVDYLSQAHDKIYWQQAIEYCQEAIGMFERLDISSARLYRVLNNTQFSLGLQDEAAQTLRIGIEKCIKPEDAMWRCILQILLGQNLYFTEQRDESIKLFEEAIPFFNSHIEDYYGIFFEGYYLIGDYYRFARQYEKAEEILKRGMAHHEALYGEYDSYYLRMLTDLYSLYAQDMNDFDRAEQVLEGRLEAIRQLPTFSLNNIVLELLWNRYYLLQYKTDDMMLRFTALNEIAAQIGHIRMLAGDENASELEDISLPLIYVYANMCPEFGNTMKEFQHTLDHHPEEITQEQKEATLRMSEMFADIVRTQLIPVLLEKEQELKEDETYLDNANTLNLYIALASIAIGIEQDTLKAEYYYRELLNSNMYKYRAVSELAHLKAEQHQYEEAISWYKQQKELAEQTSMAMVSVQDKSYYYASLVNAYLGCGKYHEAIAPAREYFNLRQQLATQNFYLLTQTERESFIQYGGVGGYGIWFLLPKFPQELSQDSYDAMLATKGLMLRASDRIKKAIMQSGNQELLNQLDSLNTMTARYKTMNTQTDWVHGNYNYDQETVELRQQIEALERNLNRQAMQLIEDIDTPDWKKLQSILKQGEAAVEYVLSDSISCGALVLLPQGAPLYVPLESGGRLWKEVEELKNLDAQRKAEILYQEDRYRLYDKLWKPMEEHLKGVKTVYYSPTGFLNNLAYAAFRCTDGGYLADRYELHQMLSTGDLVALREKPVGKTVETASLYGAVFYSPEHELLADRISQGTASHGMAQNERGAIVDEEEAFGYLSYTRQEVEQVGKILENHQVSASLLTGFGPTEEVFRDVSRSSPHILHVSTHGFFVGNDENNQFLKRFPSMRFSSMQRSGLAFVDANSTWEGSVDKPEENDGILTANEVALLDLSNTRLAVLSACQTAVGDYSMEGVYGMHRGFKQAGVKSILATLWNVNDKSTARLMELFYQRWLSGIPMQQSLHESVIELRKKYPSPFYWAPFVLMDAED